MMWRKTGRRYVQKSAAAMVAALLSASIFSGCSETGKSGGTAQDASEAAGSGRPAAVVEASDYDGQLELILKNQSEWLYQPPERDEPEFFDFSAYTYYRVTDLDRNGRLEIMSTETNGNGSIYESYLYEVNERKDGLAQCVWETDDTVPEKRSVPEEEMLLEYPPSPDFLAGRAWKTVYYDPVTGCYHYPESDHAHGGAVAVNDAAEDLVLADGKVKVNTLYTTTLFSKKKASGKKKDGDYFIQTSYYSGAYEALIGKVDETEPEADLRSDAHQKYRKGQEQEEAEYYQGMEEKVVTSFWFRAIDEKKYASKGKIKPLSDEELMEKLEQSFDSFGIHDKPSGEMKNPYLPVGEQERVMMDFKWNQEAKGKVPMKIKREADGKSGSLYAVTWGSPKKVWDMLALAWENKKKPYPEKYMGDLKDELNEGFYLWVTEDEIYYIGNYELPDPDDGGFDEDDMVRLLFYEELPEASILVCQEEELADALEDMAKGDHRWIEKHEGDIRCFRSYTSRGEGYDTADILQFVWKKDVGLIGMRSMAHPAGGFSFLCWQKKYLELAYGEETSVDFSIDEELGE